MICMENHWSVTVWQEFFNPYKSFSLSAAVAIFTFEIYKLANFNVLFQFVLNFFSCLQKVDHVIN